MRIRPELPIHLQVPSCGRPWSTSLSESANANPIRILIADDDPIMLDLLGFHLRAANFEVIEACTSASALEACIASEPALAIIDYEMPGYCGVDLARFINSHTDVNLIFLSAHAEESVVAAAIAAGALAYMVKPVEPAQIVFTVRTALQRGREMQALRSQTHKLSKALQAGRSVSIAIGLLMGKLGLAEREAFECLRRHARSNRIRVDEVAAQLLFAADESAKMFATLAGNTGYVSAAADKPLELTLDTPIITPEEIRRRSA